MSGRGKNQGVAHRAFLPTGYPDTHWGLRSLSEMLPPFKSAPTYGRLLNIVLLSEEAIVQLLYRKDVSLLITSLNNCLECFI